jgi:hypothetical protein
MNSSNIVAPGLALEPTPGLSKTSSRLSLLTAVVASQAYLIYAIFFAHALTPIGVYVIDRQTYLYLPLGWSDSNDADLGSRVLLRVGWQRAEQPGRSPARDQEGRPATPIDINSLTLSRRVI